MHSQGVLTIIRLDSLSALALLLLPSAHKRSLEGMHNNYVVAIANLNNYTEVSNCQQSQKLFSI